jgi:hydrogenase expression/formation protein HypD
MIDLERYRDRERVLALADELRTRYRSADARIMEVCGTHTMAIARFGLRGLLPEGVSLISGPGCPVCVTPVSVVDTVIALARTKGVCIMTFGDMLRVPGSRSSLESLKAEGADVRILYSAYELLAAAEREKDTQFVFISVGFETTTPGIALTVMEAEKRGLENLFFLPANRVIIPALHALCGSGDVRVDGFLCPGHVSVIIGSEVYRAVAETYGKPCVVTGFEPLDILTGVKEILRQRERGEAGVVNAYPRAVRPGGNPEAMHAMDRVFQTVDAEWRGIGVIPESGLCLRPAYERFDACRRFDVEVRPSPEPKGCRCGEVLRGVIIPPECALFGGRCTPSTPVGPCMVSSEGSCAAYYKYGDGHAGGRVR